jgi:hypothetical protein
MPHPFSRADFYDPVTGLDAVGYNILRENSSSAHSWFPYSMVVLMYLVEQVVLYILENIMSLLLLLL